MEEIWEDEEGRVWTNELIRIGKKGFIWKKVRLW